MHYLERFASSSANLRRVLSRKAQRSLAHWGGDADEAAAWIEALLVRFAQSGLLDDGAYARQQASSLHRAGRSGRAIGARLAAKGVDREIAAAALAELEAESAPDISPDLAAAARLARRRRLGPYRAAGERGENRDRDLAVLARAGFDYATARTVIDAADADSVEALVG